jgi:hypothetical protein
MYKLWKNTLDRQCVKHKGILDTQEFMSAEVLYSAGLYSISLKGPVLLDHVDHRRNVKNKLHDFWNTRPSEVWIQR